MNRFEARQNGLKTYVAEKRCKRNHDPIRYVSNNSCYQCTIEASAKWKSDNFEKMQITLKLYRQENKEICYTRTRKWMEKNRDKVNAATRRWSANNSHKSRAKYARYKASKLQRTPKWLTNEDFRKIQLEYELAAWCSKVTGEKYHVDHIIPLRGKMVSGLHVPSNLQVILMADNLKKHNTFIG